MYELVWRVVDPASAPSAASRPAPVFACGAALPPLASTLASLQLLQSHSQLTTSHSGLNVNTRSAASKPFSCHASSTEVGC